MNFLQGTIRTPKKELLRTLYVCFGLSIGIVFVSVFTSNFTKLVLVSFFLSFLIFGLALALEIQKKGFSSFIIMNILMLIPQVICVVIGFLDLSNYIKSIYASLFIVILGILNIIGFTIFHKQNYSKWLPVISSINKKLSEREVIQFLYNETIYLKDSEIKSAIDKSKWYRRLLRPIGIMLLGPIILSYANGMYMLVMMILIIVTFSLMSQISREYTFFRLVLRYNKENQTTLSWN